MMRHSGPSRLVSARVMATTDWRRVVGAGAVWTLIFNLGWGLAWYAFMRAEWETATEAIHRPMPWSAAVWHFWVVITIPLGIAIMAYARGRTPRTYRAAVAGSLTVGLTLQLGLAAYGLSQSLAWRVILLDSTVSLVAIVAAAIGGAWSLLDC